MSCASAVDSSRALMLASPPARKVSMLAACCARALYVGLPGPDAPPSSLGSAMPCDRPLGRGESSSDTGEASPDCIDSAPVPARTLPATLLLGRSIEHLREVPADAWMTSSLKPAQVQLWPFNTMQLRGVL